VLKEKGWRGVLLMRYAYSMYAWVVVVTEGAVVCIIIITTTTTIVRIAV
jgi:hypothetical protein